MSIQKSSKKTNVIPRWWQIVNAGINSAISAGLKTYKEPGIVLGEVRDESDNLTGYIVRDRNRSPKLLDVSILGQRKLVIGSKIKGNLTMSEDAEEVAVEKYIRLVILNHVKCIPTIWLNRLIVDRLAGVPVQSKDYLKFVPTEGMHDRTQAENNLKAFSRWVKIPLSKRGDRAFNEMLLKVTEVGGLEYLSKFNFIFDKYK